MTAGAGSTAALLRALFDDVDCEAMVMRCDAREA
jgi:hypothetical protein